MLTRTHDGLIPLVRWLDDLHDTEKPKATAAAFILLGQRLLRESPCDEETAIAEMRTLYRMITDGGLPELGQDN